MSGDTFDPPTGTTVFKAWDHMRAVFGQRTTAHLWLWELQLAGKVPTPIPVRPKPYNHETDGL